ncbi:MAG: catalase [Proteobacteria bacterium]|nr:MAG: catalase [Pseudomonadota bacterium]
MSTVLKPPRLGAANTAARLAMIALTLGAIAIAITFAYLGRWLTPNELTPSRFVDGFEDVNGVHRGFRRFHSKGIGVSGFFESNGNGVRLSKASVFQPGRVNVIGRFSLGNGHPDAADTPDTVLGLGLEFSLPSGELWRTTMINIPVFLFRTPEAFFEQMMASKPDPTTGKPDPEKMQAFFARHPESARALKIIKSRKGTSGFADSPFHALHAFRFVNAAGASIPVRWVFQPIEPPSTALGSKDYLFNSLVAHIQHKPLRWRLIVIVGQDGDPTNDATVAWPPEREQVDVGTLTIDNVESGDRGPSLDITFDPLVLPTGIAPSDDPLLSARSAVYSQAYTRRAGETNPPSKGD